MVRERWLILMDPLMKEIGKMATKMDMDIYHPNSTNQCTKVIGS